MYVRMYVCVCSGLLESLCYTVYDALRPIVIHTNHLETLADLCTIFKVHINYTCFCCVSYAGRESYRCSFALVGYIHMYTVLLCIV